MRAVDLEAAWQKRVGRVGEFLESLGGGQEKGVPPGGQLSGFVVRMPSEERPEALLVLKASVGTDKFVAFVGGLDLTQAILSWRAKALAGSIKWREDVPFGER